MARWVRTHVGDRIEGADETQPATELTPKNLSKEEFGRRLYNLMIQKGWRQSELARQAGLSRDSVSTYVRGISFPEPANLTKLADALGVEETALLPNNVHAAISTDTPSMELRTSSGDPRVAWLKVNRLVSTATALKIAELLGEDKLPERD